MAETSGIEWCDGTANFWIGCTKVSPACDNCYAERDWGEGGRRARVQWGPHGDRSPVKAGAQVIAKMQRHAAAFIAEHGRRPRVFINSLSDWADNHRSIQPEWRARIWRSIRAAPDVDFMLLTKRPQNIARYLPADWGNGYPNVWLGTTVENQEEANRRLPRLLSVKASRHWVSYEPALGAISWAHIKHPHMDGAFIDTLDGTIWHPDGMVSIFPPNGEFGRLDLIIAGDESGPNRRPADPDWYRSTRDQCASAGTTFFLKQMVIDGKLVKTPALDGRTHEEI